MINIRVYLQQALFFCCIFVLILFSSCFKLFADEIDWLKVSNTNNELLSINPHSIKYNNKGFLSVIAKQTEIDPEDQTIINNDSFLMAIDCENRLFSKFPENTDLKQVKNWENSINNKLVKKSIIKVCSY